MRYRLLSLILLLSIVFLTTFQAHATDLRAGASKIDITHPNKKLVEIPLLARALVLQSDQTTLVLSLIHI